MYADLAKYYDLIYSWKNYPAEVEKLRKIISKYKKAEGNSLLDVACGTGNHLQLLKEYFEVSGVDVSPQMLHVAKERLPEVEFTQSDMKSLHLYRNFDVITCLFSSIAYLQSYDELKLALHNFKNHLNPGGVLIIEPFVEPAKFKAGLPHAVNIDLPDIKISRHNVTARDGFHCTMTMHYLITTSAGVQYFHEDHMMTLFEPSTVVQLMRETGFTQAKFLKDGLMKDRGLYVGVRE